MRSLASHDLEAGVRRLDSAMVVRLRRSASISSRLLPFDSGIKK
ncbi:MAG: hypothetical protein ACRDTR_07795 [Rubrobacter sp.]